MKRVAWNKGITTVKSKPCLCGCGQMLSVHKYLRKDGRSFNYHVSKFLKSHAMRSEGSFNPTIHLPKLCACGCGQYTNKYRDFYRTFIKGHENKGRTAWNNGKHFSIESRNRMSVARLGKKPANKVPIDLQKIKELYFGQKMTRQEVAKALNVSVHVIKMRVRELRGGGLENPYHSPEFIDRMRKVGTELFKKWGTRKGPNKLEQLVYSTLDKYKLEYQKQVPLFDKFVVDAFFPKQKIILEIFGNYWHSHPRTVQKDAWKRRFLKRHGYKIEEIWEQEIKEKGAEPVLNKFVAKYNLI